MSIDGTDTPIEEPSPFNTGWYSHKLNSAGLRYEIGLCISKGYICWVNGPYMAGNYTDLKIFQSVLKQKLPMNEKVCADNGYEDRKCFYKFLASGNDKGTIALILSRHETINSRLKSFSVLQNRFRHDLSLHVHCFHAVANLIQLKILVEKTVYSID